MMMMRHDAHQHEYSHKLECYEGGAESIPHMCGTRCRGLDICSWLQRSPVVGSGKRKEDVLCRRLPNDVIIQLSMDSLPASNCHQAIHTHSLSPLLLRYRVWLTRGGWQSAVNRLATATTQMARVEDAGHLTVHPPLVVE